MVDLPASKSICNRALIINALAGGGVMPDNVSDCDDTRVIIDALRDMPEVIDIHAAGTAMRFMTAYLAVTPGSHLLTGTERMKRRPIKALVDALRYIGADIEYEGAEGYPPLRINGRRLDGGRLEMSGGISSHMMDDIPEGGRMCIFEYVYFARSDSVIDGCSVYRARQEAGRLLAECCGADADIVSGVPDSANVAARAYSAASGIPFAEALAKNRYVGRTFIQPEQSLRENGIGVKLNAIRANIEGKRIVLVDDSIVRGTTMRKIVKMLREAGAREVHVRVCSPAVVHPCHLGIDIRSRSQLIGAGRSEEQIAELIGADSVRYLPAEQLVRACGDCRLGFCLGCFNGEYPYPEDGGDTDKYKFE